MSQDELRTPEGMALLREHPYGDECCQVIEPKDGPPKWKGFWMASYSRTTLIVDDTLPRTTRSVWETWVVVAEK